MRFEDHRAYLIAKDLWKSVIAIIVGLGIVYALVGFFGIVRERTLAIEGLVAEQERLARANEQLDDLALVAGLLQARIELLRSSVEDLGGTLPKRIDVVIPPPVVIVPPDAPTPQPGDEPTTPPSEDPTEEPPPPPTEEPTTEPPCVLFLICP